MHWGKRPLHFTEVPFPALELERELRRERLQRVWLMPPGGAAAFEKMKQLNVDALLADNEPRLQPTGLVNGSGGGGGGASLLVEDVGSFLPVLGRQVADISRALGVPASRRTPAFASRPPALKAPNAPRPVREHADAQRPRGHLRAADRGRQDKDHGPSTAQKPSPCRSR